ncbi:MAG TPA: discoidin domain-containing protein, partial [bacterium]|nr:discoidin domain-containing protein [bacterium]
QQQLLKDDAYIIGVTNSDPHDLARKAAASASSAMPDGRGAENVINGIQRGVGPRANRWSSDPNTGMPQWLRLDFQAAQKIREVHLVFDTGLNRQLTLTHSESAHRYQVWGPQTETVKDYELQVLHGESAETVAKVEGNYQRKRVHRFDAREATGLRLVIHATNGAASAHVFEIRAYG